MKCCVGDQWQCDEARITEPVSVRSMLRLWKLTDKLQRGGVCACWEGRIDPDWRGGGGQRVGGGEEVVGDHGVRR